MWFGAALDVTSAPPPLSKDRPDLSLLTVGRGPRHSYSHDSRWEHSGTRAGGRAS
jgi:hypothetical protein